MQTSFRVKLDIRQEPAFRARKTHAKSRGGCNNCKKRRVKCDEERPCCSICVRRQLDCIYAVTKTVIECSPRGPITPASSCSESTAVALHGPSADAYNLSIRGIQDRLAEVLSLGSTEVPGLSGLKPMRDLQHFQAITTQTLGFSTSRKVIESFVSQAVWKHTHLMHMVLAVANAHQKRLYSIDHREAAFPDLPIAEASHWQIALTIYQQELERLNAGGDMDPDGADALLGTHLLSTVFTSTIADNIPADIFITGDEDAIVEVLSPLIHSGGFTVLLRLLPTLETDSAWTAMLSSADDEKRTFTDFSPGIDGLPPAWVDLCGLTTGSTAVDNPYHRLLKTLTPLLSLRLGRADMPKLFAYIGRNWMQSRHLFISKDPIALLFIAWWLALLRQLNLWWLMTRASTKCAAIVKYLRSLNDSRIQPFLSFPASFGLADYSWIWSPDWRNMQLIIEEREFVDPQHQCLPS